MTSAYYYKSSNELRVYNRNNSLAHNVVKTTKEQKKVLKGLGFTWDKYNHSYVLKNPSEAALNEIEKYVAIKRN